MSHADDRPVLPPLPHLGHPLAALVPSVTAEEVTRGYQFAIVANGQRSLYEIAAHSLQRALFLLGIAYVRDHPGTTPDTLAFRIEEEHEAGIIKALRAGPLTSRSLAAILLPGIPSEHSIQHIVRSLRVMEREGIVIREKRPSNQTGWRLAP